MLEFVCYTASITLKIMYKKPMDVLKKGNIFIEIYFIYNMFKIKCFSCVKSYAVIIAI